MANKFIASTKPTTQANVIKVEIEGKEVWATCSPAVKEFARNNFNEGDLIEFTYEQKNGKYNITSKVTKVGGSSTPPPSANRSSTNNSSSYTPPPNKTDKGTDVNNSIKRQAIGHMTSRTLISMQGLVDPNNIEEITRKIYALYQELVG